MKRHWKWLLVALVALVVVAGGWRAVSGRRAQQAAEAQLATQRAQPTVELAAGDVVRAEVRELQRALPVSGSLKAVDSAYVKARVPGELQGLCVRPAETGGRP